MTRRTLGKYRPLARIDDGESRGTHECEVGNGRCWKALQPTYMTLLWIIGVQAIVLLGIVLWTVTRYRTLQCLPVLYSPAREAVEHEIKVFHVGFGDYSPFYRPSSKELDDLWEDLYDFGISKIPKEQAARLPNKTHAVPGDEGYYIAELDVFHNLHCLNMIRKALDPGYYPDWDISTSKNASDHIRHCVDWIRQSIMCHADTSVIVWQWSDHLNQSVVKGNIAHTCRDFDRIQEWAKARKLDRDYDFTRRVEDDIVIGELYAHDL